MLFWNLPNNKYLAFIPRTGSTAWGQAILDTFYPQEKLDQIRATTPKGNLANPQYFIPCSNNPQTGNLLAVIRNPIDRFRSGFSRAAKGRTVDQLIDDLQTKKEYPVNIHIRSTVKQFERHLENIKWYCYDTQLNELATEIGLTGVPNIANESDEEDKPILTDEQIAKLNEYYSDDVELYLRTKNQL